MCGSVKYLFHKRGIVSFERKHKKNELTKFLAKINAIKIIYDIDGIYKAIIHHEEYNKLRSIFRKNGILIKSYKLVTVAKNKVRITNVHQLNKSKNLMRSINLFKDIYEVHTNTNLKI